MIDFKWQILELSKEDNLIIHAKYLVTIIQDGVSLLSTEGNHWFSNKIVNIPFNQVTEQNVVEWIKNECIVDNQCHIESNLFKQFQNTTVDFTTQLPWKPKTFKLGDL